MKRICLVACLAAACSGGAKQVTTPPAVEKTEPSGLGVDLSWLIGRWERAEGIEHWTAARDVLWGVGFTVNGGKTAFFEVLLVEKGEGGTRYVAFPGGQNEVAFPLVDAGAFSVLFANPGHDFPKRIGYAREMVMLRAKVDGDGRTEEYQWLLGETSRAQALEAADLAFARDTLERGIEGWVAAFDPAGAMWGRRKKARMEGAEAIRETMSPLFAKGTRIEWQPIASGLSPAGDLGYTVGTSRFIDSAGQEIHAGSYVTIWRRQEDGSWKVLFDTGV